MLPVTETISLGEGQTPLVEVELYGQKVACKLEYLSPTGSFKDRGASVLVSALVEMGIERVVEDSSGNAGASLAAYCARAGLEAQIYIPDRTSPEKVAQIEAYGAQVIPVTGPRERTAQAAQKAAEREYYASHYWNPLAPRGDKNPGLPDMPGSGMASSATDRTPRGARDPPIGPLSRLQRPRRSQSHR